MKDSFEIVAYDTDVNLRQVSHNWDVCRELAKVFDLQHQEAVLFINKAQNRFRLIVMFYKIPCLLCPPVDPSDLVSLYLKISAFLRQFSARFSEGIEYLDGQIEHAQTRIERRKELAKKAKKKRPKKKKKAKSKKGKLKLVA
jgi:hypothetical protein